MHRKLNVVELYAGVARTWDAFRDWNRCKLGLLVDVDDVAVDNYLDNYPTAPYLKRNLQWLKSAELKRLAGGQVDVLLGCPPCQGFSDTGKRDPDDPRNVHISVFGRFIRDLQPRVIAMENVPLVVNSKRFRRFTSMLDRLGYKWAAEIVNAAQYGSCQTRQRLLLVAAHSELGVEPKIPTPTHGARGKYFSYQNGKLLKADDDEIEFLGLTPGTHRVQSSVAVRKTVSGRRRVPTVGEVLADLPDIGSENAQVLTHIAWDSSRAMQRRMGQVKEGGRWRGGEDHYSHSYGRLHRRGLARTITTYFSNPGSGRFWHPVENRPITIREAARIQGFDDAFLFHGPLSHISRLIGNALDSTIARVARQSVETCLES